MPVGIFLLVSAITALSVYAIEQVETQRTEAQHRQMTSAVTGAVERLANANAVYLRTGAALLSLQERVTPASFREFAGQLQHDDTLRRGGAMGWAVIVHSDRAGALDSYVRELGLPALTIHPRPVAAESLPVIFVEPDTPGNRLGVGFDILSDPVRRAAVERAVATVQPTASGPVTLVVETGKNRTGFNIFMPVYAGQGDQRRLRGVIARGFNAQRFLQSALAPQSLSEYGVALYDAETPERQEMAAIGPQAPEARRVKREVMVANHRMALEISPPAGAALSNLSLLTLLFGMMVAALLLVVARLITDQAAEDRAALAWFEEQASIRNSLTRELNHRVKNTLANVLSIVALTRRRTDNIDEFVSGLIGRVRALSATHDLLTQSEWGTTPIRAVVGAELAPYAQDADRAVMMRGPHVELAPPDALSLGLAIHELATNASKYGSLSAPGGHVEITWEMITDKLARIDWCERGGPPVATQRRRGFGTELIEKIVAHELRNPVDLRFEAEGVHCTLIVPVRPPANFQIRARDEAAKAAP